MTLVLTTHYMDEAEQLCDRLVIMDRGRIAGEFRKADVELDALIARGGVDGWIAKALEICDLPQNLAPGVKKVIMAESGGNANAISPSTATGTPASLA